MRRFRAAWTTVVFFVSSAVVVVGSGTGRVVHAQATPLRLAPRYAPQTVENPQPLAGSEFGGGIVNAGDLNRDGRDDLLVSASGAEGRAFTISGADGRVIYTLNPPDPSPTPRPPNNNAAGFGQYIGKSDDLGSCSGGQPGALCPRNPIGAGDGVPELVVTALSVDVGPVLDIGRAYVFDGATGALLKRIDMPAADIAAQAAVPGRTIRPQFGRTVLVPSSPYPPEAPQAVKIGDVDGGGRPDIIVGSSRYFESGPATNPACNPGPCDAGRAYYYRGEDIAGSNPALNLDTPFRVVKNPSAQTVDPTSPTDHDSANFGHAVAPIGDVGRCNVDPGPGALCVRANSATTPDGRPEVVVSAHREDGPTAYDVGAAYLLDGATGSTLIRYAAPEPQPAGLFGFTFLNQPAIGDVGGGTAAPDVYLPALFQKVGRAHQGRGYFMNGNFKAITDLVNFAQIDDPTPIHGGNFGSGSAGIGNVAGDPRNEILVGQASPFIPGEDFSVINDVHVFEPVSGRLLLTITEPEGNRGSGFGRSVAPLGDLNSDGFIDFAVGAPLFAPPGVPGQGRLHIFRSAQAQAPVQRSVSLDLRQHLLGQGRVIAPAGPAACIQRVPVEIRRNGATIRRATTTQTGTFSVRLRDLAGRYQAVATAVRKGDVSCAAASSPVRTHRH